MLELARQIIERETSPDPGAPEELAHSIERAFGRLEELMITLVGSVGFGAVMDRALHQTRGVYPWLAKVEVSSSATVLIRGQTSESAEKGRGRILALVMIGGLPEAVEQEGAARVREGTAALLANTIGLLCGFIGEDLTFRLLRRVWAELPRARTGSGPEEA